MLKSWQPGAALLALLFGVSGIGWSQQDPAGEQDGPVQTVEPEPPAAAPPQPWIDRAHEDVHALIWRSAMHVDRMFGSGTDEKTYQEQATGSITPALLWDQYGGWSQKFRFRVKLPLPQLDERYHAFIGTFNRDEYVTERDQQSGAIPQQHARGEVEEDQTLIGIGYRQPQKAAGRWEVDGGMRLSFPLDPFVKAGYRYQRGDPDHTRMILRETAFWQNSEGFGITSRIDLERAVADVWWVSLTASATLAQRTKGVRGYSSLTAYRGLSDHQAVAMQAFVSGEQGAEVPVGEYGFKAAYRQTVLRDWLVLEIRPSVTWPKEHPYESRAASWGLGVGLEILFGEEGFQPRPATF